MTKIAVAIVALISILAVAALAWIQSVRLRDASIADTCWGLGFVLLAWMYVALGRAATPRACLAAVLVTVWGIRLSVHIARRSRGHGEDPRYAKMRAAQRQAFWWRSLFTVFWLQAIILWFVSLPLLLTASAARPPSLTVLDGVGILLFAVGFSLEAVGDAQLRRFRNNPSNRGRVSIEGCGATRGIRTTSAMPYLWWGVYALAASTPGGWLTLLSPLLMTFLLVRVSGLTLLEESLKRSKPGYSAYVARTPAFFPWFPGGS